MNKHQMNSSIEITIKKFNNYLFSYLNLMEFFESTIIVFIFNVY